MLSIRYSLGCTSGPVLLLAGDRMPSTFRPGRSWEGDVNRVRVYVSHSHTDNDFCEALATALRVAGADVYFDTHVVDAVCPGRATFSEITRRGVFAIVLSKAALSSTWVQAEYQWAQRQYDSSMQLFTIAVQMLRNVLGAKQAALYHERASHRHILPVVVERFDADDFKEEWRSLLEHKHIEEPDHRPYSRLEAIERTLKAVAAYVPTGTMRAELAQIWLEWGQRLSADQRQSMSLDDIMERMLEPLHVDTDLNGLIAGGNSSDEEPIRQDDSRLPAVWCVVANVAKDQPFGPGGKEIRRGIKHFAPGAKVYCFPSEWGDGYEKIRVVGRHRGSHRYVTIVIPSKRLTSWHADLVYSPHVIAELAGYWDGTATSKRLAEEIAAMCRDRESSLPSQITR